MSSEGAWDVGGSRAVGTVTARRVRMTWSRSAWAAIAVTVGFVALTGWWLAVDRSVQYGDSAQDLFVALRFRELIAHGELGTLMGYPNYYPPVAFVLGALATFVGSPGVTAPVIAQNLVFVPLLALACYRTGRRVAGSQAGLFAVVFALGVPLLIEQFHVFMLDAPQAALVATSVWLVLASERFRRVGVAALAGVALGFGVETKELAPLYLLAFVAVVLARDGGAGRRNWRGLLAFAATAFATGAPWYLWHASRLHALLRAAGAGRFVPPAALPAPFSFDNALWYGWATLNSLLLAPLCAFAAVGVALAVARVIRTRPLGDPTLELLVGLVGAWTVLTFMPHHDLRYTMPLVIFLAVLGTAWIVRLPGYGKPVAIALLLLAVGAAHVGATFGVGGTTERRLPGNRQATLGEGVPLRDRVVAYTNQNFLVSGPHGGGDVLQLMRGLHAAGVRMVYWQDAVDEASPLFERIGVLAFAVAAGLEADIERTDFSGLRSDAAVVMRDLSLDRAPPCVRLYDGTGVWVRLGDPARPGARDFCPMRRPATYGP
ncbi:MAG TPA: glycosyltransferase family 39 protein [Conexibacter sp.]|jgi:4-amino-4-deoxy-L-arabinose transferase-like glycosyltransferase|nr:glycosyltransferase family 39 protein [Conexibacter sp.]